MKSNFGSKSRGLPSQRYFSDLFICEWKSQSVKKLTFPYPGINLIGHFSQLTFPFDEFSRHLWQTKHFKCCHYLHIKSLRDLITSQENLKKQSFVLATRKKYLDR